MAFAHQCLSLGGSSLRALRATTGSSSTSGDGEGWAYQRLRDAVGHVRPGEVDHGVRHPNVCVTNENAAIVRPVATSARRRTVHADHSANAARTTGTTSGVAPNAETSANVWDSAAAAPAGATGGHGTTGLTQIHHPAPTHQASATAQVDTTPHFDVKHLPPSVDETGGRGPRAFRAGSVRPAGPCRGPPPAAPRPWSRTDRSDRPRGTRRLSAGAPGRASAALPRPA